MNGEGSGLRVGSGLSAPDGADFLDSTSIAAHELKAPLALVRQLALELKSDDITPSERVHIASQIELVAERSLRLSTNLTKYKQLQDTLFVTRPLNVNEVWRDVLLEAAPLYKATGRTLRYKTKTRQPLVLANHDLLRRIILNFVDNALHYSDADGVVTLYSQLIKEQECVRLGVRDYGPAVPAGVWSSLKRTALINQPVHARPNGSGLGLRIAAEFAESMNGRVGAIRHRDGASFYVDIPITRQLSLL